MRKLLMICLLVFYSFTSFGQTRITGSVIDETGAALSGVSVIQKGSTSGTITGEDGAFTIVLNESIEKILEFTMIGYQTLEVNPGNNTSLNVVLKGETQGLEEVIVIGYGTQKKVSVTGAISSVDNADMKKAPVASVTNALSGRVPGLITRQSSGRPGQDDAQLFIRGRASFNNSNPLVLVDGVERDFRQVNVDDIENVSILKDASATAVYGVRGANGVVLVTTKRGAMGRSKIAFVGEYGVTNFNRLTEALDAETTSLFQREGTTNVGINPAVLSNTSNFPVSEYDNYLYRTQLSPFTHPNNNFVDMFTKPGNMQKYNINVTGGNKVVKYFVSVGYLSQDGMFETDVEKLRQHPTIASLIQLSPDVDKSLVKQDYNAAYFFNRITTRSNIDINLSDDLKLGVNMSYLFKKENRPGTYDGLNSNAEGMRLFGAFYRNAPQAFPLMNPNGSFAGAIGVWRQNPLVTLAHTGFRSDYDNQLETSFTFNYNLRKVLKGLSVDGRYAYDANWSSWRGMQWRPYLYAFNPIDSSYLQGLGGSLPNQDNDRVSAKYDQYVELALRYKQRFGKHDVSGLLLGNYVSESAPGGQYSYVPHIYQGLIGRVQYEYDNRYLLDVNMGYNGSNRFAKGHRFQLFPSFSVGWIFTNEDFMGDGSILNFGKLRGSYGQVGNDKLGAFSYYYKTTYVNGQPYSFGDNHNPLITGLTEGRLDNENIRWETATKYNIGLETRWFDNKITFNADVFKEHRTDILTIPEKYVIASGVNALAPENIGVVDNKGYELELGWQDKLGEFSYFAKAIYSYARNEIKEMSEAVKPYDYMYRTGHSIGQFFGYKFDKFFSSYEEIAASPQQFGLSNLAPGDMKYVDINKDGIIDQNDETAIGSSTVPQTTYSFTAGFDYKGFDLSVLFQGATTSSVYMVSDLGWDNSWGNYYEEHRNRWTPETALIASYPRFLQKSDGNHQNYFASDFWLRKGDYLRLKNIQVGYRVSQKLYKRTPINSIRLYASAFNLVTWDEVKRVDPESGPDRNNGYFYPQQRIINFGLNVNF